MRTKSQKLNAAIEITSTGVRLAVAKASGSVLVPVAVRQVSFGADMAPADTLRQLAASVEHASGGKIENVTLVLSRPQVFMREVPIPPCTPKEFDVLIPFEAERHIPYPASEAVVSAYPIGELCSGNPNKAMVVSARTSTVQDQLDLLAVAGLSPRQVTVSTFARASLMQQLSSHATTDQAYLFVDDESWESFVVNAGDPVVSRGLRFGAADKTNTVMHALRGHGQTLQIYHQRDTEKPPVETQVIGVSPDIVLPSGKRHVSVAHILIKQYPEIDWAGVSADNFISVIGAVLLPGKINLLPEAARVKIKKKEDAGRRRNIIIGAGIVICGGTLIWGALNYRAIQEKQRVTRELRDAHTEFYQLQRMAKIIDQADRFAGSRTLMLDILLAISKAVPAQAYVAQLDYDYAQSMVLVRGRTNQFAIPSRIVEKLQAMPLFERVTARGAHKMQVNNNNLVDFEIECQLRKS
jgi:hypothetical protein